MHSASVRSSLSNLLEFLEVANKRVTCDDPVDTGRMEDLQGAYN